jgi:signal transduction histidine kinase/CheY-like chemotaxis protein
MPDHIQSGEVYDRVETQKYGKPAAIVTAQPGPDLGEDNGSQIGAASSENDGEMPSDSAVLKDVLDSSVVGLIILDACRTVVWVNHALAHYLGIDRAEMIGRDYQHLFNCRFRDVFKDCTAVARQVVGSDDAADPAGRKVFECHVLAGDGRKERWLEHRSRTIHTGVYAGGRLEHYSDISVRKKMETTGQQLSLQLQHAQKMESVGTLAGGIAHDFNNLLQAMSGYTQLLLMDKETAHPDFQMLMEVENAAGRASELTQQLLAFSRRVDSCLQPTNLNTCIEHVKKILERTIPPMIEIEVASADDLAEINGDVGQIEQVLMNLGINACQAMPDGGKMTFTTRNVHLDQSYCETLIDMLPGDYVQLSVSDTGLGMDGKTQEHVFEPFFTTREIGEGTGLGLSMVYGIVQNHGGHVHCASEPGCGSTFTLHFPVVADEEKKQPQVVDDRQTAQHGSETVLIVDDDMAVLNLCRDILERYGYRVMVANSGESALEICRTNACRTDRIDLILLDVNMPGMGGEKCLEEVLQLTGAPRILVASGHPPDDSLRERLRAVDGEYVAKPYGVNEVLRKVRRVLDRR